MMVTKNIPPRDPLPRVPAGETQTTIIAFTGDGQ